ncbi:MAG: Gfo/Idh/MocA family oxidoreductase [Clostridia bacterium]|nr:Gfo/Idh/MocA family oxidoreductase [Clostridia bacterium]
MEKLKVGIIGTGGISRIHTESYQILDNVEVVACCDIDGEKVKAYAEKYNIPRYYTDCREMMKKEKLDLVSVTTWNAAHCECTVTALRGGANVICEKPMAMNAEEAELMERVAKEEGKVLQVGFVRRFGGDVEILKKFEGAGIVGDIYYAKAVYLRRCGFPGGWFGDKDYSGGGALIDLAVHFIDLVRYIAGGPKPVSVYGVTYDNLGPNRATGAEQAWKIKNDPRFKYDVEDFASALIRFDNGLTLSIETSFNLNCKRDSGKVELFGTKGGVVMSPEFEIYTDLGGRFVNISPAANVQFDFTKAFNAEIKGFVDAATGKAPCVAPAADGVVLMKILDAIYESARTGHEVVIK